MSPQLRPLSFACLLAAVAVPAQATWVYDSGGGGNFTDLQVAVDSVAPGDTILLRSSWLQMLRVQRSVHLVGDAPGIHMIIAEFRGLTNRIDCTLSDVTVSSIEVEHARLSAENVDTAGLDMDDGLAAFANSAIDGRRIYYGGAMLWNGSRATFDSCQLRGSVAGAYPGRVCYNLSSSPAVWLTGSSSAQFAGCTLEGPGIGYQCLFSIDPGRPGLVVDAGCTADLARSSVGSLGTNVPAITGTGTVRVDGAIILPPFAGAVPAVLPSTSGTGVAPGGVMQALVEGPPGLPAVIVTSFGLRSPVLAPQGLVWVDLNAFVVLRIGFLDSAGLMSTSVAIPAGVPRGLSLTMQGAVALPNRPGLLAASPTVLHVL